MSNAAEVADTFDTDFAAMREDDAHQPDPRPQADHAPADDGDQGDGEGAAEKPDRLTFLEAQYGNLQKALKAERQARKAAERLAQPAQQQQPQALPSYLDGLPDPDQDPIGALHHFKEVVKRMEDEQRRDIQTNQQQNAQNQYINGLVRTMQDHEADFRAENPAYDEAAAHFKQSLAEELQAQGWGGAQLANKVTMEMLQLVERATQGGRDPADVVWNLAQRRGFKPSQSNGQGGANIKVDETAKRLQQIASGQAASGALSRGVATESKSLTFDSVTKLEGAALDSAYEALKRQERRAGR